jgi:hypothetical protein
VRATLDLLAQRPEAVGARRWGVVEGEHRHLLLWAPSEDTDRLVMLEPVRAGEHRTRKVDRCTSITCRGVEWEAADHGPQGGWCSDCGSPLELDVDHDPNVHDPGGPWPPPPPAGRLASAHRPVR